MTPFQATGWGLRTPLRFRDDADIRNTWKELARAEGWTLYLSKDDGTWNPFFNVYDSEGNRRECDRVVDLPTLEVVPMSGVSLEVAEALADLKTSDLLQTVFDGDCDGFNMVRLELTTEKYKSVCTVLKHILNGE